MCHRSNALSGLALCVALAACSGSASDPDAVAFQREEVGLTTSIAAFSGAMTDLQAANDALLALPEDASLGDRMAAPGIVIAACRAVAEACPAVLTSLYGLTHDPPASEGTMTRILDTSHALSSYSLHYRREGGALSSAASTIVLCTGDARRLAIQIQGLVDIAARHGVSLPAVPHD